jgi:FkbM family methyltransferase
MKNVIKKAINLFGYSIAKSAVPDKVIDERADPHLMQRKLVGDKKDLCIFDVGAHYGETALRYNTLFPGASIYSFEPFPDSVVKFRQNVREYSNIKVFEHALSNVQGESILYSNSSDATNSLLDSNKTDSWIDNETKTNDTITVKTDTVDSFCQRMNIGSIDILKLDVQGAELLTLQGASGMLQGKKINLIYTEVEFIEIYKGQPLFHDITTYLLQYGYKLFGLYTAHTLETGQLAWGDAIYTKE